MAKKSAVEKNGNRWRLMQRYALKRKKLKASIMDKNTSAEERFRLQMQLNEMPRNSSFVRYRNRCLLTGRARGTYRYFKVSRIMLRELALTGKLPGVVKASW